MAKDRRPRIRTDGLQIEEHRRFQERLWTAERVAWVAFVLILVLALAGLTGAGGPLSRANAALESGTIDYPRVSRWEDADSLAVTFAPGSGERSLTLSPSFAKTFQIEDIQPQPVRFEARPEGERMVFAVPDGASADVTFHIRAQSPGIASYSAAIDGITTDLLTVVWP